VLGGAEAKRVLGASFTLELREQEQRLRAQVAAPGKAR